MAKFKVIFTQMIFYSMEISAEDEDAAKWKFEQKMESLTNKQLEKYITDCGEFDIEEVNKDKNNEE